MSVSGGISGKEKPRIVITGEEAAAPLSGAQIFVLSRRYSSAVARAGGLPLMPGDVRLAGDYAEIADALILTEGPAVHRGRYGKYYPSFSFEEMRQLSVTRDEFEFSLFREFRLKNKPVLGIGRGMDIINIALGGTLGNLKESAPECPSPVAVSANTELGRRFPHLPNAGTVKRPLPERLGGALKPWALGPGKIPEGIELPGVPVFGIQWHPEWEHLIMEDILGWFIGEQCSFSAAPEKRSLP